MTKQKHLRFPLFILSVLILVSCGKTDSLDVDHIAVQFDKNENWSIIDSKGNVVVKEEYPKDNEISIIRNGVYWVKDKSGYQLFSVDSPKKPLINETFDKVSIFMNGRAVVARKGQPIKIITDNGSVVKELPSNIASVSMFSMDGSAAFFDAKKKKYGLLDTDGNIVIEPRYSLISNFLGGYALAKENADDNKFSVIAESGEVKSTLSEEKYTLITYAFFEGLIPVTNKGDDSNQVSYISPDGTKQFTIKNSDGSKSDLDEDEGTYVPTYVMYGGHAVFANQDGKYGLIDKKGETVIRAKYDEMRNVLNGTFIAKKGDKYGVVDAADNTVLDFDYEGIAPLVLGGNYIVVNGKLASVVTPKRENLSKDEFVNASCSTCDTIITNLSDEELAEAMYEEESVEPDSDMDPAVTESTDEEIEEDYEEVFEPDPSENVSEKTDRHSKAPAKAAPADDMSWLCTRIATANDIAGISKADLRIMRNYIYARHGYKFKSKDLMDYFSRYPWYSPRYSDVTSQFSSIEKKNIAFIQSHE